MYFTIVVLFLVVCPLSSVAADAHRLHVSVASLSLIGKWWSFWAVGVRLLIAGIRQVLQPRFTAEEIFEIHDSRALPIVREIGFGNLSMGTLGILALFHSDWLIPAAIVGGLYYGFAGLGHLPQKNKNAKELTAMISDLFVAAILAWFVFKSVM